MGQRELVRVAVVGAGGMAREHIRAFADLPEARVVGIHSRTRAKAEALASEFDLPCVADSVADLHERTGARLAVVAVPELAANAVSRACFTFPWMVLLEKPAGYDLADALDIAQAAEREGRQVYVALNRRSYSSTRTALLDLDEHPGPRFIRVLDQQDQGTARSSGQPEAVVSNWMYANSIHTIDYLRVFGRGAVTRVERVVPWNPDRPGVVLAAVHFASGDIGLYEGVWNGPGPWAVTITAPARMWELRPLEQAGVQLRGERRVKALEPSVEDREFKPGFRVQAQLAVRAALGQPSQLPTLADALETMRLIHQIFQTGS